MFWHRTSFSHGYLELITPIVYFRSRIPKITANEENIGLEQAVLAVAGGGVEC